MKMAGKGKKKKAKSGSKQKPKKAAKSSKKVKKAKPKAARRKSAVRKKSPARAKARKGQISASEKASMASFNVKGLGGASGGQSGDLQGISEVEGAASESVEELLEEGNTFEAEVVAGVQRAGDADEREVRTHEVNEDDVPEEYQGDQDRKDRG
jgi:hypothetical protein